MGITQAVILAGGLGTRLQPFTLEHPKPMIEIGGVPFLEHLIRQVRSWGIERVVLLLGYKPEQIEEYFGDGSRWGVKITYSVTPVEYDTGARLWDAVHLLDDEFMLMYCDNYCPIKFDDAYAQFAKSGNLIQLTAYANRDGYTKNNLAVSSGQVTIYDKKRLSAWLSGVDIGYAFVKKEALNYLSEEDAREGSLNVKTGDNAEEGRLNALPGSNVNFEACVYPQILAQGKLGAYVTEHRYYSIGSWERIELTREFFRDRKVVFLDRDGTLNVRPPKACYVEKPEDFVWLPNAIEAVALLKANGCEIYLITNQPGIARGNMSVEDAEAVNAKMMDDLAAHGTGIDGIYMCPHGWDDGCECRKPKPGMLYQAQKEHSVNLSESILIGDDERDIQTGQAAGVKACYLVTEDDSLWDIVQRLQFGCQERN